jgi:hypothetical protein
MSVIPIPPLLALGSLIGAILLLLGHREQTPDRRVTYSRAFSSSLTTAIVPRILMSTREFAHGIGDTDRALHPA